MASTLRRSQLAAQLAYGPQIRGLQALLADAAAQYAQGVSRAHSNARGSILTARASRPQISGLYKNLIDANYRARYGGSGPAAKASGGGLAGLMAQATAGQPAGSLASMYAQASAQEYAASQQRAHENQTAALQALKDEETNARRGEAYAIKQAGQQYQGDASKIGQQLIGALQDQGTYQAKTYGDLMDAAQKLGIQQARVRATLRGQDLADARGWAGLRLRAAEGARGGGGRSGGKGGGKGKAPFTRSEYRKIETAARTWIPKMAARGMAADAIIDQLVTGVRGAKGSPTFRIEQPLAVGALRRWRRYGRKGATAGGRIPPSSFVW